MVEPRHRERDTAGKPPAATTPEGAEQAEHKEFMAFADSTGAILKPADQHIALGSSAKHKGSPHFASSEVLLEQLRRTAALESMDMVGGLIGNPKDRAAHYQEKHETEHSILQAKRDLEKLTPEQLKNIADIASAAHDRRFDDLVKMMKGYENNPTEFAALNTGLQLEFKRRGINADVSAQVGTNEKNQPVARLSLKTHEGTTTTSSLGGQAMELHNIVSRDFASDGQRQETAQWEPFAFIGNSGQDHHRK